MENEDGPGVTHAQQSYLGHLMEELYGNEVEDGVTGVLRSCDGAAENAIPGLARLHAVVESDGAICEGQPPTRLIGEPAPPEAPFEPKIEIREERITEAQVKRLVYQYIARGISSNLP